LRCTRASSNECYVHYDHTHSFNQSRYSTHVMKVSYWIFFSVRNSRRSTGSMSLGPTFFNAPIANQISVTLSTSSLSSLAFSPGVSTAVPRSPVLSGADYLNSRADSFDLGELITEPRSVVEHNLARSKSCLSYVSVGSTSQNSLII
jgi:hypothetical protein